MWRRDALGLLEEFEGLEVVVVGDVILDGYLKGRTERLCREAPVPVVALTGEADAPGGAANAAANLAALGARVTLLSVVGEDDAAGALRRCLDAAGVPSHGLVVDRGRATPAKRRLMADGQMLARIDQGTTSAPDGEAQRAVAERLEGAYSRCAAVVVSDYACGVVSAGVARMLARLRAEEGRARPVLAVDAKRPDAHASLAPTLAKPNFEEAVALLERAGEHVSARPGRRAAALAPLAPVLLARTGAEAVERLERAGEHVSARPGHRAAALAPLAPVLLARTGAEAVVVTLDSEGALLLQRDGAVLELPPVAVDHAHPSGAGDTFLAAATLSCAAGGDVSSAARLAGAAAGVAVRKPGTAPCTAEELRDALAGSEKYEPDPARLAARLAAERERGRRVVFTNGCFDILHGGHIAYLDQARRLGDVLVVGVNTDESVCRIKGPSRPVNPLPERVHVLSALSSVDAVVPFGEDTADALLAELRPDVFAKGGDYLAETVPEAAVAHALGIELVILPLVDDRSTSGLIERIVDSSRKEGRP
ncbi:MAG: bifunctional heptose 7-phosphate kinase/heptose 1-phosphate adenyltransferase [Coriobacteriia bacterium]|nr:bifunctional heptose 7-phosphate kinase/heptose 1-phosphate adenyltransferase [Coriobacteriia bacterium]